MVHQRTANGIALGLLHDAIDSSQMNEQGRNSQLGVGKIGGSFGLAEKAGQGVEQGWSPS